MANTPGFHTSAKADFFNGITALGTTVVRASTAADSIFAALYYTTATITVATTAYSSTGEVSGTGYTAGGQAVTNATPATTNSTSGVWTPSASLSWTGLTITTSFDTCLLYNNSASGKNAIASYNFGAQTITAGTLALNMPANTQGNALLQIT